MEQLGVKLQALPATEVRKGESENPRQRLICNPRSHTAERLFSVAFSDRPSQ